MVIDHIGIVVRSLDAALTQWVETFGYEQMTEPVLNSRQKVRVVFVRKDGSTAVKLVEPADPSSPVSALAARGGGLHHLCFRADDMDSALRHLKSAGARVLVPPEPGQPSKTNRLPSSSSTVSRPRSLRPNRRRDVCPRLFATLDSWRSPPGPSGPRAASPGPSDSTCRRCPCRATGNSPRGCSTLDSTRCGPFPCAPRPDTSRGIAPWSGRNSAGGSRRSWTSARDDRGDIEQRLIHVSELELWSRSSTRGPSRCPSRTTRRSHPTASRHDRRTTDGENHTNCPGTASPSPGRRGVGGTCPELDRLRGPFSSIKLARL